MHFREIVKVHPASKRGNEICCGVLESKNPTATADDEEGSSEGSSDPTFVQPPSAKAEGRSVFKSHPSAVKS